jgi:hypothetical protein
VVVVVVGFHSVTQRTHAHAHAHTTHKLIPAHAARVYAPREATTRPDMLFVASSGNNGTDPLQWLNFPSAYDGVISVGAVDCNNEARGRRGLEGAIGSVLRVERRQGEGPPAERPDVRRRRRSPGCRRPSFGGAPAWIAGAAVEPEERARRHRRARCGADRRAGARALE